MYNEYDVIWLYALVERCKYLLPVNIWKLRGSDKWASSGFALPLKVLDIRPMEEYNKTSAPSIPRICIQCKRK